LCGNLWSTPNSLFAGEALLRNSGPVPKNKREFPLLFHRV